MVRGKNPLVDLKLKYKKVFVICLSVSVVLHSVLFLTWRSFKVEAYNKPKEQVVIKLEDIPETRQVQRPPSIPRPSVPIGIESEDLADDVTIEPTDLDLDQIPDYLPPPPPPSPAVVEEAPPEEIEEIVEFWHVEVEPKLIKQVMPEYPEIARKAGMEGQVILKLLVGKDGKVEKVEVLKGPEIFRQSAIEAAKQFLFSPAMQNDRPVKVWVSQVIRFKLE